MSMYSRIYPYIAVYTHVYPYMYTLRGRRQGRQPANHTMPQCHNKILIEGMKRILSTCLCRLTNIHKRCLGAVFPLPHTDTHIRECLWGVVPPETAAASGGYPPLLQFRLLLQWGGVTPPHHDES